MSAIEKLFAGLTVIAVVATIFTSPYSASIFGNASTGVAKIYQSVKH